MQMVLFLLSSCANNRIKWHDVLGGFDGDSPRDARLRRIVTMECLPAKVYVCVTAWFRYLHLIQRPSDLRIVKPQILSGTRDTVGDIEILRQMDGASKYT